MDILVESTSGLWAFFWNLKIALACSSLPAIFGFEVSSVERDLLSLPLQMGGLGISNPVSTLPTAILYPPNQLHHLLLLLLELPCLSWTLISPLSL